MEVWMVTFESKPLVKVGGLGEVPVNLSKELVKKGFRVKIVIPSHGLISSGKVKLVGDLEGFKVATYRWNNIEFLVLGGNVLEDPEVYGQRLVEKFIVFGKAVGKLLESRAFGEPKILHFHDWHSVLALVHSKRVSADHKTVFHIHMLSRKYFDLNVFIESGLNPQDRIYLPEGVITVKELHRGCNGLIEKIAARVADRIVTVSKAFLVESGGVLDFIGKEFAEKSRVVYNGTDWSYQENLREVLNLHKRRLVWYTSGRIGKRKVFREYFLKEAISRLGEGEPKIPDPRIRELLESYDTPPFKGGGRVEPFKEDGPLVLMTGRLSSQKGFDVLVRATPRILEEFGDIRIVVLPIPFWEKRQLLEELLKLSFDYPDNVRVLAGYVPSVYKLAHLAADVFLAPSRYEPFGIMALEAMVSGIPVIASKTGGLSETVLDIREWGEKGTGLHVKPGDSTELALATIDMATVMETAYREDTTLLSKVTSEKVLNMLQQDLKLGYRIRESCIKRVEECFTWEKSSEQLIKVYEELIPQR